MSVVKLPGLIDPHVHLRDPGATHKEDFVTGTRAALAGGFTMVVDMPNNPGDPTISPEALLRKRNSAEGRIFCDVGLYYGATPRNSETYQDVLGEVFGLKLYLDHTTGDLKVEALESVRQVMSAWPAHKPLLVHAEDRSLAMVLGLLPGVGRGVHLCHVSQKVEIELIREAKERGLPVTCEVAPHHLWLTEADLPNLRGYGEMKPPLKKSRDVAALWDNLDVIDMIATDHAPHTTDEKLGETPAFGVPGLETSLPIMLTAVHRGELTLDRLVEMMHTAPARIFHLPRQDETYITVETEQKGRISAEGMETKCAWTPFEGVETYGAIKSVVLRGREVVQNGQIVAGDGTGRVIVPLA